MARVILTTCGTSLYNSSCWSWGKLNEKPISGTSDRIELRKRQIECERAIISAKNQDSTGVGFTNTFDMTSWNTLSRLRDLPAELASLKAIKMYLENPAINQPLTSEDKIILLHSENSNKDIDGRFCADMLKEVITKKNLLSPVAPANIETKVIENLDPANRDKFSNALNEVWHYARTLQSEGNSIILNLTGGYKALAILLGAFGRQFQGIPMFYLHEEAGYDQIFMMKFENGNINGNIVFSYYNANTNNIFVIKESVGGL
ncbi:MAG: hypothetical protein DDT22_00673 [candidate division WS2 bacterium]|nr:hypothetical protein [Bacillota bacterium]MBT9174999.1 hypothetical protein [Candidatus Lithacetigena glycinireducens]